MENEGRKITISTGSWVRAAVVVALAYAFYQVSDFLLILIASIVIAAAIEPATLWAKRHNIPRLPAVISIYVLVAIFLSGFFYFLLLPLIGEVSSFVKTLSVYSNAVANDNVLSGMFETQNVFGGIDTQELVSEFSSQINSISQFLSQGVLSSLSAIFGGILSFVLIVVLSFYLAVQDDGITKFLRIITPHKYEDYAVSLWKRSQIKIGYWMQGQLFLAAIVMALVYPALLIVGVPHALLLAVLAGIMELIPLVGATIAAIPAIFVAYGADGLTTALIVAAIYVVIQQLENHVIYPMVVRKVVGVPPMVSIIALVIGGQLAGFLGVLIAVPVAAVVMEFISDIEQRKIARLIQEPTN